MSPALLQRPLMSASRGVTRGVSAARRGGHETLRSRDLQLLGWLGEQYAARVDQLEVLLGCGPRTVQRVLARLREAGLVTTRRVLVGEPAWVFPTGTGLRATGHSFGTWSPRLGLMAHVAAVNDVRLHIGARSPESEWVPERLLERERQPGEHLPDAVVITEGQRVAIEVELTVKSQRRVQTILNELTQSYDATLYFCTAGPHRQLSQLADTGRWPTLGVRELPPLGTDAT
jgi:acetolactate synthase regulatory subunit/DNA-binding transcriptional ArsR family regulator